MKFKLWLESVQSLYVRFGDISGASQVKLGKEFDRRGEAGLSVYKAEKLNRSTFYHGPDMFDRLYASKVSNPNQEHYQLDRPNSREAIYSIGTDYWSHMLRQYGMQGRPIYLVTGKPVSDEMDHPETGNRIFVPAHGSDGEPLLDPGTVHVIKRLDPSQVFAGNQLVSDYYG